MRALITQSNYIPWKGYFDNIALSDVLVVYDSVQYTKRDWRNRNLIKTPRGPEWLTIPVSVKGKFQQSINETQITDLNWNKKHLSTIKGSYSKAQGYKEMKDWLESAYLTCNSKWITEINIHFVVNICEALGITIEIRNDSEFELAEGKTEKLVSICDQLGANEYLTGSAAKEYMENSLFEEAGVRVLYSDYDGYPEYQQCHGEFLHQVSTIDLILNNGSDASKYLKR